LLSDWRLLSQQSFLRTGYLKAEQEKTGDAAALIGLDHHKLNEL
jgi:hypothetical protein